MFCFATRKDEDRWAIGDLPSLSGAAWKKEKEEGGGADRCCFNRPSAWSLPASPLLPPAASGSSSALPESGRACPGTGDMDQWTECLLSKQEDLSLSPCTHGCAGGPSLHP